MLMLLPQALVDGLLLGGIYLTLAMGFSMAYGVLHIIDFAVGEWIMLGAFIGLHFNKMDPPRPLSVPAGRLCSLFACHRLPAAAPPAPGRERQPRTTGAHGPGLHLRPRPDFLRFRSDHFRNIHSLPEYLCQSQSPAGFSKFGSFFHHHSRWFAWPDLLYALLMIRGAVVFCSRKPTSDWRVRAVALNKEAAGLMGVDVKKTASWLSMPLYVGISAMTGVFLRRLPFPERGHGAQSVRCWPFSWWCWPAWGIPARCALGGLPAGTDSVHFHDLFQTGLHPCSPYSWCFIIILLISPKGMFQ